MTGEEVLPVAFCASLSSALHVLSAWKEAKGNQSRVNYNDLLSNSTLYLSEQLYSMYTLNVELSTWLNVLKMKKMLIQDSRHISNPNWRRLRTNIVGACAACHTTKKVQDASAWDKKSLYANSDRNVFTTGGLSASFPMHENPVIGVTEYMLFRRGELRFAYETQGIDYSEETSINKLKLSIFVRRHLLCFTRLQGLIWTAERVSSSLWPHSKWEARGPVGLATVAEWSATLTAFGNARLDVDHIGFSVQPHYRPWRNGRGGERGGGDENEKRRGGVGVEYYSRRRTFKARCFHLLWISQCRICTTSGN